MLRRWPRRADREDAGRSGDPSGAAAEGGDLHELRDAGWVLPLALATGERPAWTLVGTVDSRWATMVDPRGLVTPSPGHEGFSLDWWIGADDRWHLPSREAGVRQRLIGGAPVVETLMRIPGGDAVQRVYGIRATAPPASAVRTGADDAAVVGRGGDEYVVVEVENRSSVPFAVALSVRPFTPEQRTDIGRVTLAAVSGGSSRGEAHAATANDAPAVIFPRRPARAAGSSRMDGDVAHVVQAGAAPEPPSVPDQPQQQDAAPVELASCPDGFAQAAFVFPLAHTAVLRCVIPLGTAGGLLPGYPPVIPSAEQVAAGWEAHAGRGASVSLPDQRLQEAVVAARRVLLLAPWGEGLRHAGPTGSGGGSIDEVADTARIVGALDRAGHHDEAARTLARWSAILGDRRADRSPMSDSAVIDAVATHRLLAGDAGDQGLFNDLLADVVAAVERLANVRSLSDLDRWSAVRAVRLLARALSVADQPKGAVTITGVADRLANGRPDRPTLVPRADVDAGGDARTTLLAARAAIAAGDPEALGLLARVTASASPTHAVTTEQQGHDLVVAALVVDAVRDLLVGDVDGVLALLRVFPEQWYGGAIEVHHMPTASGRLSFAVRWHGERPALLWELEAEPGAGPVRITAPGLDPGWSTTESRGEALLAPVDRPAGLEALRVVAEHPEIDPAMRRPGSGRPAAEPTTTTTTTAAPPIEGGTFS